MYSVKREPEIYLFIAETEFGRNMSQIMRGSKDTKTVIFLNTVREGSENAFSDTSLQSTILSEGLEMFGPRMFRNSKIKITTVPRSVIEIHIGALEEWKIL